jgi:hypothetical protein
MMKDVTVDVDGGDVLQPPPSKNRVQPKQTKQMSAVHRIRHALPLQLLAAADTLTHLQQQRQHHHPR